MARRPAKPPQPLVVTLRERLPAQALPLADALGDRALLALLEAHGGTRLSVPRGVAPFDPLAVLLGTAAAERLAREFGGSVLSVPLCKQWRASLLRGQGLTYAAIGRRLGMHEMSVHRLIKRFEEAEAIPGGKAEAKREMASLRQMQLLLD